VNPPCLDCGEPLTTHPGSDKYPGFNFSNIYLCPFCRTHRYRSEAAALARCQAGLEKRRAAMEIRP
jgi:hypothetical protein